MDDPNDKNKRTSPSRPFSPLQPSSLAGSGLHSQRLVSQRPHTLTTAPLLLVVRKMNDEGNRNITENTLVPSFAHHDTSSRQATPISFFPFSSIPHTKTPTIMDHTTPFLHSAPLTPLAFDAPSEGVLSFVYSFPFFEARQKHRSAKAYSLSLSLPLFLYLSFSLALCLCVIQCCVAVRKRKRGASVSF